MYASKLTSIGYLWIHRADTCYLGENPVFDPFIHFDLFPTWTLGLLILQLLTFAAVLVMWRMLCPLEHASQHLTYSCVFGGDPVVVEVRPVLCSSGQFW